MMEKRILALCNTPLQLIACFNLRETLYKRDSFDIIISDHMANADVLYANADAMDTFDHVYYVESFLFTRYKGDFFESRLCSTRLFKKMKGIFFRRKFLRKSIELENCYDIFLFNSVDIYTNVLFEELYRLNRDIQVYFVEEGFSSYCVQGEMLKNLRNKKILYGIEKILGINKIWMHLDGLMFYRPDKVKWDIGIEKFTIPPISPQNRKLIGQYNELFGFNRMTDVYDKPIIFFEESFRKEGMQYDDVELVQQISEWVGKDNIMVKIHPRNDRNVYKEMGYKTNENIEIPWEIIVLNIPDIANRILISIGSGSIATPNIMFGIQGNAVSLLGLSKSEATEYMSEYFTYLKNEIFDGDERICIMPKSMAELKQVITGMMDDYENVRKI